MAAHSSILAWRIPWTEEPGGLWSMESLKNQIPLQYCKVISLQLIKINGKNK